jgi:hypothetical protein
MGLHVWFAPEVLFSSDPFAKLERCEEPGLEVSRMHVYRFKHQPRNILRLNAVTGWPHSLSDYQFDQQQNAAEVSRTEFYGWQHNAELAPFGYEE